MDTRAFSTFGTVEQSFRVETVERFERFQQVRDDWRILTENALDSFPMLTHEWLTAWWSAFAREQSILVILVCKGEDLVGAAPFLYHYKKSPLGYYRVLRPWANSWVDKFTFLAVEPAQKTVDAILTQALTGTWDMLELPRLASDSPVSESIR